MGQVGRFLVIAYDGQIRSALISSLTNPATTPLIGLNGFDAAIKIGQAEVIRIWPGKKGKFSIVLRKDDDHITREQLFIAQETGIIEP